MADIHGRADLLGQMLTVIDADLARSRPRYPILVFLGDYIDRGPETCRTIDILIRRGRSHQTVFLKGNHEAYMLEVLKDPAKLEQWKQFGGLQTLRSYGLNPPLNPSADQQTELIQRLRRVMPVSHFQFLRALKPTFTCGDFFFVHAGVRPGVRLEDQHEQDLFWIRKEFLETHENFGKYIVHGHTPVSAPDVRPNRINIDTGAYATGNLTLLTIQGSSMLAV